MVDLFFSFIQGLNWN